MNIFNSSRSHKYVTRNQKKERYKYHRIEYHHRQEAMGSLPVRFESENQKFELNRVYPLGYSSNIRS